MFLEISQSSQENSCARVSFLIKVLAWGHNFFKKETLAQLLSCEFCEISRNNPFTEHLRATASGLIPEAHNLEEFKVNSLYHLFLSDFTTMIYEILANIFNKMKTIWNTQFTDSAIDFFDSRSEFHTFLLEFLGSLHQLHHIHYIIFPH